VSGQADGEFQTQAGNQLAALPGVQAVTLGGSRAAGTAGPDSDWDFAIYYRGERFRPESLRSLGWPGEIFPIGGWGGGVFNGGAWLTAGRRKVDVHYRDLADIDYRLAEAAATLGYARTGHAPRGHLADTAGAIATAACQTAHAVLAERGEWITNEKTLLDRAGLRGVDTILAGLTAGPAVLGNAVDQAEALLG
jgi:Nucleotidyltransferase domain